MHPSSREDFLEVGTGILCCEVPSGILMGLKAAFVTHKEEAVTTSTEPTCPVSSIGLPFFQIVIGLVVADGG